VCRRKKRKGRPKKKWSNTIMKDMRIADVYMKDVEDRAKWRFRTKVADPK